MGHIHRVEIGLEIEKFLNICGEKARKKLKVLKTSFKTRNQTIPSLIL